MDESYGFKWPEKANDSISLGDHEGRLRIPTKKVSITANVSIQLLPRPVVIIQGHIPDPPFNILLDLEDHSDADITFKHETKKTKLIITRAQLVTRARQGDAFVFSGNAP